MTVNSNYFATYNLNGTVVQGIINHILSICIPSYIIISTKFHFKKNKISKQVQSNILLKIFYQRLYYKRITIKFKRVIQLIIDTKE